MQSACSILWHKWNPESVTKIPCIPNVLKYCSEHVEKFTDLLNRCAEQFIPFLSSKAELCVPSSKKMKISLLEMVNVYHT